jgi:pimeloyl-ACP methyl ester carboxylesterase
MKILRNGFCALAIAIIATSAATAQDSNNTASLVKLEGQNIEYFSQGEGDVVIMLTGRTLSASYLGPLAHEIVKQGHRAVVINRRGAGQSTGSLQYIDYHTYAGDVRKVMQALDITQADILGHALGGRIARTMAADFPQLVNSVILLAVGDEKKAGEGDPEEAKATMKLFQPDSTDEEIRVGMGYMVGNPDDVDRVWKILAPSRYTNPEAIRAEARIKAVRNEWWAPEGDMPYLVVQGLADKSAPPGNAIRFENDMDGRVTLVELPGIGHLSPIEAPDVVAAAIATFLD